MDTPSLRQLDIFAQMVASGNVARCAQELGLSIDAVEQDMASLEMRLGYKLFEQQGEDSGLTPAGRKTVRAMALLSETQQSEWEEATPASSAPSVLPDTPVPDGRQQVTIAAPAPVFGHFQDALSAFEDANGDVAISLDLSVQTADEAARALKSGAADIAYFYALGAPEDFASHYVWSEQLIVYLGAEHPLAERDAVTLDELADVAPLVIGQRNGLRRIVEQALGKAGLSPAVAPALESDNLFEIMTAVRDGAGYFAAFGPLAQDFGRMAGIRRVRLIDPLPPIEIRQAVNPAMVEDPVVQALAEYLFR